jgi:hypothetical protein
VNGDQCVCCLQTDGFRGGVEVDPSSGLCLYCQPCPTCGETGSPCYEDGAGSVVCFGKRETA